MEKNKYFTPQIEDIRVGYECEHTSDMVAFELNDRDSIIYDKLILPDVRRYLSWVLEDGEELSKFVRVPYLTLEQIKTEGWVHKRTIYFMNAPDKIAGECYEKDNFWLVVKPDHHLSIIPIDPSKEEMWEHAIRFAGECKCINEFRYILKLLNI